MIPKNLLRLICIFLAVNLVLSQLPDTIKIVEVSPGERSETIEETNSELKKHKEKHEDLNSIDSVHHASHNETLNSSLIEETVESETENLRKKNHHKKDQHNQEPYLNVFNTTNLNISSNESLVSPQVDIENLHKKHNKHHEKREEDQIKTSETHNSTQTSIGSPENSTILNNKETIANNASPSGLQNQSLKELEVVELKLTPNPLMNLIKSESFLAVSEASNETKINNEPANQSKCFETCVDKCKSSYSLISEVKQCALKACLCEESDLSILTQTTQEQSNSLFNFFIDVLIVISILSLTVSLVVIGMMIYRSRQVELKYENLHDSLNLDYSKEMAEEKVEQKLFESNYELMTTEDFEEKEICIRDF
jgi:hypothetical protein